MAEHTLCSGCHRKNNPEYPTAPKLMASCWNCHAKNPPVVPVAGEGRKVKLTVSAAGPETANISETEEFFKESFANSGFEFAADNSAEISAEYKFEIEEVFDSELLPEKYGLRLFKGSCKISVFVNGKKVLETGIESKARSGSDPAEIVRAVLHYMKFRAYDLTTTALSKELEK